MAADVATVGLELQGRQPTRFAQHANLTVELAMTQFKLKYTGSLLGYVWSLLKPLFYFGIMYFIFVYVFKQGGSTTRDFGTQLLVGIVVWTFFADATSTAIASVAGNGNLVRKASFPRVVLVVASTMTAIITFVINMTLVVVVTAVMGHMHLGLRSLAAVPLICELYLLVLGIALLLAALFVFYRDLGHLWEIFSLLLFYGSAVVFPIVLLTGRILPRLVGVNPVAQIIEDLRRAVVVDDPTIPWTVSVDGWLYVVPLATVVVVLALGVFTFRRLDPRFAENL